jgi:hypothetical protein
MDDSWICQTLGVPRQSRGITQVFSAKQSQKGGRRQSGGGSQWYKQTQFQGVGRPAQYPAFHYSILPPFQSDVDRAKRTQFGAGNRAKQTQFALERWEGQVLYGRRVMVNWTGKGARRNKANLPRASGNGRGLPGPGRVPANRLCKTKPICYARPGMGAGGPGRPRPGLGAIVRNEANFGQSAGWTQGPLYKQSQFADRDSREARTGGAVARAHCAKQSQIAQECEVGRTKPISARGAWNPPRHGGPGRGGATGTIRLQFRVIAANVAQP